MLFSKALKDVGESAVGFYSVYKQVYIMGYHAANQKADRSGFCKQQCDWSKQQPIAANEVIHLAETRMSLSCWHGNQS